MKKILAILLLIPYLITAIGLNLSLHHCGGEITSVSFGIEHGSDCPCGSKEMKKDCCDDEHVNIKLNSEQQSSNSSGLQALTFVFIVDNEIIRGFNFKSGSILFIKDFYSSHHPPDFEQRAIFKLNTTYII